MIQLTDANTGKPLFIKPGSIDMIAPNHTMHGSVIRIDGQNCFADEEPEEVQRLKEESQRGKQ